MGVNVGYWMLDLGYGAQSRETQQSAESQGLKTIRLTVEGKQLTVLLTKKTCSQVIFDNVEGFKSSLKN